jgi:hypothetical protein
MTNSSRRQTSQSKADADQARVFRKAARELGCDDNEGRFQQALRTLAKTKPKPLTKALLKDRRERKP